MKININTQFIYIVFFHIFFTRSMTNPLCHIDITFSAIMKEKLNTIKSILIILLLFYLFFFRSFFFSLLLIKNESFVTHTPVRCMVYGIWVCAQPKLRVLRIFLLSVCLAIIHVRHLVTLFPALWCHIKPRDLRLCPNSLLIRHVVRYDYVESVLLPTKLQQLCATHTQYELTTTSNNATVFFRINSS